MGWNRISSDVPSLLRLSIARRQSKHPKTGVQMMDRLRSLEDRHDGDTVQCSVQIEGFQPVYPCEVHSPSKVQVVEPAIVPSRFL